MGEKTAYKCKFCTVGKKKPESSRFRRAAAIAVKDSSSLSSSE